MNLETKLEIGLSFDDVILSPQYSDIESRSLIDLSVDLGKNVILKIPIVSSPMSHVTESAMAISIAMMGGLALLHRFCSIEEQIKMFRCSLVEELYRYNVGCSVGAKEKDKEDVDKLVDAGCKIICIDVAHGHSSYCGRMTEWIAKKYPEILLISGNVATGPGARFLAERGADIIRVGIGSGSSCLTRINAGAGVPQLTALYNAYQESFDDPYPYQEDFTKRNYKIIADGGIRCGADAVKALCFSELVLLGNYLAGTAESPGQLINIEGKQYKAYEGSSTHKTSYIEGVKGFVPRKGTVRDVLEPLLQGIRSGMSYVGVDNLIDLKDNPPLVRMTNAGLIESHSHTMKVI